MSIVLVTSRSPSGTAASSGATVGRLPGQTPRPRFDLGALAYTLVEVMIGLGLFAIIASSLLALTWMVRSSSEENVYDTMALAMAQSYMEQLRGVSYPTLQAAADSTSAVIPLLNASGAQVTDTAGAGITNGDANWATETVYLDQNAQGTPIQPMKFSFKAALTDLLTVTPAPGNGSKPVSGIEVVITFQCSYNFGIPRTYHGSLRSVISAVPTY